MPSLKEAHSGASASSPGRSRKTAAAAAPSPAAAAAATSSKSKQQPKSQPAAAATTTSPSKSKATQPSKKAKTNGKSSALPALPYTPIVEGAATTLPLVFTRDADYFFAASSSSVKIHSRSTGKVVSTLSPPTTAAKPAQITSILLHPTNPLQLITAALDGTVRIWDYLDAVLLRTVEVGYPITHLTAHANSPSHVYVAVRKPKADKQGRKIDPFAFTGRTNSIVYSVSLETVAATAGAAPRTSKSKELLRIGKTRDVTGLQISPSGEWLVAIGNRKVQIARTNALRAGFTKYVSDASLVSLAFHPTEPTFATGDVVGKIRVWHCLDEGMLRAAQDEEAGEKHAPSTVLHWHAHAVTALSFTPNGAYLVSGGEEAVLVLWQLSTGQREYIPRLGAPINAVTVADGVHGREQEYALVLADGSLSFVGSLTLKVSRSFARIKVDAARHLFPPARQATMPFPLAVEPVTGQLVLPSGHPSSLQFFDVANDQLVSELEVAPSNRVSRPDEVPLEPTRIDLVAFSSQPTPGVGGPAEWMATVDSRAGGAHMSNEVSLKIWRWSAQEARYVLNTRIDKPHEDGVVSSIAFSPASVDEDAEENATGILLVSTGRDDRKIKTWRLTSRATRGGARKDFYWVARSVAGYRNHAPHCARWSPDGSVLAVAQGSFLTLWEPVSNSLVAALACPEVKPAATAGTTQQQQQQQQQHLEFVGRSGRFVAISSGATVVVWDLVRSAVHWHKTYESGSGASEAVRSLVPLEGGLLAVVRAASTGSGSSRKRESVVDVFDVAESSAKAVKTYALPLAVRDVAFTAAATKRRTASPTSTVPNFFAVTSNFDVLQIGATSDEDASGSSGSRATGTAQSLRGISVKRRTLFDDLFGPMPGMLTDEPTAPAAAAEQRRTRIAPTNSRDIFALFDAPAHLLPPVGMLFDAFVPAVLPPRRDAAEEEEGEKVVRGRDEEEDDEQMDVDDAASSKALAQPRQIVRSKEDEAEDVRILTDLFAKQLETPATSKKSSGAAKQVNGSASTAASPAEGAKKTGGRKSSTSLVNGSGSAASTPQGKKGGAASGGAASPPASSGSKAAAGGAGKKRKSLS